MGAWPADSPQVPKGHSCRRSPEPDLLISCSGECGFPQRCNFPCEQTPPTFREDWAKLGMGLALLASWLSDPRSRGWWQAVGGGRYPSRCNTLIPTKGQAGSRMSVRRNHRGLTVPSGLLQGRVAGLCTGGYLCCGTPLTLGKLFTLTMSAYPPIPCPARYCKGLGRLQPRSCLPH